MQKVGIHQTLYNTHKNKIMDYTLDSVTLVKKALKKRFPDYRIDNEEKFLVGAEMAEMKEKENRFFFGILTVSDVRTADLTFNEKPIIQISEGSQIGSQLFTAAEFKNLNGDPSSPEGLFLGHEINVLPH
ncbi:hypothetical protein [Christiangramia sp. SM2212]|uniref:Uncharacterized protein n=1 Tax=Christiangramia sediminicola TaxID=3073267 RepID=A0ABU1EPE4_9FLAO|nr:hypothetical protein [Christiangramia sp. SM2212]MDR5590261.1 hypothetical protein [Christiangramia sp. SM2212]